MKVLLNIPTVILILFLARILIFGAAFGDALVMMSLSALYGAHFYLEAKKETPLNKAYLDRLIEVEQQLQAAKDKISAITLTASLRK